MIFPKKIITRSIYCAIAFSFADVLNINFNESDRKVNRHYPSPLAPVDIVTPAFPL